jgi:hypothetical protein
LLHGIFHRRESGFVLGGSFNAKVTEVSTEENIGPFIFGRPAQVVDEILRTMVKCTVTPKEAFSIPPIDPVATARESSLTVIVTVLDLPGYPRNVDKPIVGVKGVRREPENQIPRFARPADHWLANGERKTSVLDARCPASIRSELVEIDAHRHSVVRLNKDRPLPFHPAEESRWI